MQLAGRMALKRQQRVIPQHAAAVINDANQPPPAVFNFHANAGRTRIQRVFEEFFDYRRRAFNYFAGRNLVGYVVRKDSDTPHSFLPAGIDAELLQFFRIIFLLQNVPLFAALGNLALDGTNLVP